MDKANLFWQIYKNLEDEVLELAKYIFFTDTTAKLDSKTKQVKTVDCIHQLETYSTHIADLLVRCCVEIEAISKELYFDNGGTKIRGGNDVYFDTDCIAFLNNKWILENKIVTVVASTFNFTKEENRILTPLKNAEKRSKAYWVKAYQAVKHDRYNSLYMGNVKALLHALATLYLLNIYYKDIKLSSKYLEYRKLDMSFNSKVFALKLPDERNMMDVVNGNYKGEILKATDSPYIIKYTDSLCKQILGVCQKGIEDRNAYWKSQPELNEAAFIQQMLQAQEKEKQDPRCRVLHFWELCKYRINKKVPKELPFEERKILFTKTSEWHGHIRQMNKHLKENELTEENIQAEIDSAGVSAGMELDHRFENERMRIAFTDGYCELVLDKGNVRYNI